MLADEEIITTDVSKLGNLKLTKIAAYIEGKNLNILKKPKKSYSILKETQSGLRSKIIEVFQMKQLIYYKKELEIIYFQLGRNNIKSQNLEKKKKLIFLKLCSVLVTNTFVCSL